MRRVIIVALLAVVTGTSVFALVSRLSAPRKSDALLQANVVPASAADRQQLCIDTQFKLPQSVNLPPAAKSAICSCVLREISQSLEPREEELVLEIMFFGRDDAYVDDRIGEWSAEDQKSFSRRARALQRQAYPRCVEAKDRATAKANSSL